MAEKEESPVPMAPSANGYVRTDAESGTAADQELRKKKRKKCILFIVAFAIFQTAIILLFALTVMRFKSPKFRVRSGSFDSSPVGTDNFTLNLKTEFGVKNTNFGHFKYDMSNVVFEYRGTVVGRASIEKARARARSTRKFDVNVVLTSAGLPDTSSLTSDISSGKLTLTSTSLLEGKIHLFKLIKKKKSAQMNCTMDADIQTKTLQNIICK